MNYLISFFLGVTVTLGFFYGRIRRAFINIFGGSIDKIEFGGLVFTAAFIWMIYKEGTRPPTSPQLFNELYILFVSGAAMTGLGLNNVLEHIKDIKGVKKDEAGNNP